MNLLNPVTLPLEGKHLIEASAGTGKTFNITRLFLRTLLEKALPVEQILVMTFSKAATEEIRGRVAETLNEAIEFWQARLNGEATAIDDPVYQALFEQFSTQQDLQRIQAAVLVIDEASIYTIHSFCQQVLATYAFDTGVSTKAELRQDNTDYVEQAIKDWLRSLRNKPDELLLLAEYGWHTPDGFKAVFERGITTAIPVYCRSQDDLDAEPEKAQNALQRKLSPRFERVFQHLCENKDVLKTQLVSSDPKKETEQEAEWAELCRWLEAGVPKKQNKLVDNIIHGRRYSKNDRVKSLMEPIKALKDDVKKSLDSLTKNQNRQANQQAVLSLVFRGIQTIKQTIKTYKNTFSILEFDDLVLNLADAVEQNPSLASELEAKYPVALVDEFQDTDDAQYRLLAHIYTNKQNSSTLMMIGDPKQAIYGFRGGDIFTYLKASEQANYRWHMDTNWRSTKDTITAYNGIFNQADFDFNIAYLPVAHAPSAKANNAPLRDENTHVSAMQFVYCDGAPEGKEKVTKAEYRRSQSEWLASEILRLFEQTKLGDEAVQSKDVAILVRSANEASSVATALRRAGITHVYLSNQKSVYASLEAYNLLIVLRGIFNNTQHNFVRAAATVDLLGQSAVQQRHLYVEDKDSAWDDIFVEFTELKRIWINQGVLPLLQVLIDDYLLLNGESAERILTNYQHLAELLQAQSEQNGVGSPEKLLMWLAECIDDPKSNDDSSIQRLEKDENAVQIVTQHKSKGLEYPIVFIPFISDYKDASKAGNSTALLCRYYDDSKRQVVQQIGDTSEIHEKIIREGEAEAMRLFYVALTRAMHRCYLLISPFDKSARSAVGRALSVGNEDHWQSAINAFCDSNAACTYIEGHKQYQQKVGEKQRDVSADLIAPAPSSINTSMWRLLSFSGLLLTDNHWRRARADELVSNIDDEISTTASRFTFPKGAGPGNVLHDVLEHKDFSSDEWLQQAKECIGGVESEEHIPAVLSWLDDALAMPIQLKSGATLCLNALTLNQTLKEAEFYYPLNAVNLPDFITIIRDLRQEQTERHQPMPDLDGMMHGFIDLIFEFEGKFYVADYKSTFMGNTIASYSPDKIALNMIEHNYDIQALIYSVALHRYLEKSLPDYDPELHFGGAIYLYLRGMSADNIQNEGIALLPISAQMVCNLDGVFAGATQ